jgi:hypothetical protein
MTNAADERSTARQLLEMVSGGLPMSGMGNDDDDPNDEHAGENEARVHSIDETTEAPEEFEIDDEDKTDEPQPRDYDEASGGNETAGDARRW